MIYRTDGAKVPSVLWRVAEGPIQQFNANLIARDGTVIIIGGYRPGSFVPGGDYNYAAQVTENTDVRIELLANYGPGILLSFDEFQVVP